jgi:hypothetical protein
MILVLVSGLALAAYDYIRRMEPLDFELIRQGAPIFIPFFILLILKFGLAIGLRARRRDSEEPMPPSTPDDAPLP